MGNILSNVMTYQPHAISIDNSSWLTARRNAIKSTDEYNQKAQEYKTQIETTLAAIPFNEKEDKFKQEYIDSLNQVAEDNGTKFGIGTSLNALIAEYGNIMKDPQFIGRMEAQEAFTTFQNAVKQNTTLSEDQKEYYLEKNPYYYADKVIDAEGHERPVLDRQFEIGDKVIGGSRWEPVLIPQNRPNYNDIFVTALNLVAKRKNQTGNYKYYDINGNIVTDVSKADFSKLYLKDEYTKEEIRGEDLWNEIFSIINQNNTLKNAILQDMDYAYWADNKHLDQVNENGVGLYGGIVNGQKVSKFEDYVRWMYDGSVQASKYKNTDFDRTIYAPTVSKTKNEDDTDAPVSNIMKLITPELSTYGATVDFTYQVGNINQNTMNHSKSELRRTFDNFKSALTSQDITAMDIDNEGNVKYNGNIIFNLDNINTTTINGQSDKMKTKDMLLDMLNKGYIKPDQYVTMLDNAFKLFDDYTDAKINYDNLLKDMTDEEKLNANFLMRMDDSDFKFSNYGELGKKFNNIKNMLPFDNNGKHKIEINEKEYNAIKYYVNSNNINLNNYGIDIKEDNGKLTFILDSNFDNGYLLYCALNANGIMKNYNFFEGFGHYLKLTNNMIKELKNSSDKKIEQRMSISGINTAGMDLSHQKIRQDIGKMKISEFKELDKIAKEEAISKINSADFVNYTMYAKQSEDGSGLATSVTNSTDRANIAQELGIAITKDPKDIDYSTHIVGGIGAGVYITYPVYNADGEIEGKKSVFVPDLLSSEARIKYNNDPSTKALNNLTVANEMPGTQIYIGNKEMFNDMDDVYIKSNGGNEFEFRFGNKNYIINNNDAMPILNNLYNYRELWNKMQIGTINVEDLNTRIRLYTTIIEASAEIAYATKNNIDAIKNTFLRNINMLNYFNEDMKNEKVKNIINNIKI